MIPESSQQYEERLKQIDIQNIVRRLVGNINETNEMIIKEEKLNGIKIKRLS